MLRLVDLIPQRYLLLVSLLVLQAQLGRQVLQDPLGLVVLLGLPEVTVVTVVMVVLDRQVRLDPQVPQDLQAVPDLLGLQDPLLVLIRLLPQPDQ